MVVHLTEEQKRRWLCHMRHSKKLARMMTDGRSSWIAENRDPYDVSVVLQSICRYGFRVFYYRHIRRFFKEFDGKPGYVLSRVRAVNVLHALKADGFVDMVKRKDGNRSQYTRLFDVDDWERVFHRVVGE
jgi:hypothetical protein